MGIEITEIENHNTYRVWHDGGVDRADHVTDARCRPRQAESRERRNL